MVESYRTEEEQLESIKQWFRDYGRSVLLGGLTAAVLAFGIYSWQQRQLHLRDSASVTFENMMHAMREVETDSTSDKIATAKLLANTLKSDYGDSAYAQFGALYGARLAVQQNDLASAESDLRWVLDHKPSGDIKAITQLRLARVLHAKGDDKGALALLDVDAAGSYAAAYAQFRGDILLDSGDTKGSQAAYLQARELEQKMGSSISDPLLDMKLHDVAADAKTAGQGA